MSCLSLPKYRTFNPGERQRKTLPLPTASSPVKTMGVESDCRRRQPPPVPVRIDSVRGVLHSPTSSSTVHSTSRCLNTMSTSHFIPLQSVQEDEYFDTSHTDRQSAEEQQPMLIDMIKETYARRSQPLMSRHEPLRSSLPFIVRPAMHGSKSNSLGLCFLICENETKKVSLPPYISCLDTLKALFVRAFPQQLTMKQLDTDQTCIYIREIDRDIFYQLEDVTDVKDRSVLKLVHIRSTSVNGDPIYQTIQRSTPMVDEHYPSISEQSRSKSTGSNNVLELPVDNDDARIKIGLMEKQLASLTELVKQLTHVEYQPTTMGQLIDSNTKSLYQQLRDLKIKTFNLRDDLSSIRRMQLSLQENFQQELEDANRKIEEQLIRLHQSKRTRAVEDELEHYIKNSVVINRDLEDLENSVEQLQIDVDTKHCYLSMNDVESFALALSTISRSLVDLKTSFPRLREKLLMIEQSSIIKFLHEEPEHLDYTIKKCKRLTTMLYQLKRSVLEQEKHSTKPLVLNISKESPNRKRLFEEIQLITFSSDRRLKAIERAEKMRARRLIYERQLETLKTMKLNVEKEQKNGIEEDILIRGVRSRASISSSDSNRCPSPSLSLIVRQALLSSPATATTTKESITVKGSPKKIVSSNKKVRPIPAPSRLQNASSSSSAVSSASSTSSSCAGTNSRLTNSFCGILPLLSVDRRHYPRCYSFSSSSTDNDSVISNSRKSNNSSSTKVSKTTTVTRPSVTDL